MFWGIWSHIRGDLRRFSGQICSQTGPKKARNKKKTNLRGAARKPIFCITENAQSRTPEARHAQKKQQNRTPDFKKTRKPRSVTQISVIFNYKKLETCLFKLLLLLLLLLPPLLLVIVVVLSSSSSSRACHGHPHPSGHLSYVRTYVRTYYYYYHPCLMVCTLVQ